MLLESIEALNFRNLSGTISWGNGLNILVGNNGQGKTNWLEAIYVLATSKSFRAQRLNECVRFGGDLAIVRGRVRRSIEIQRELQIAIQGNTKSIQVNGKREPISRYLGQLHAVSFTAADLEVVRGQPDARRRFIDRGIVSLHPSYVQTLGDYNRVIKQKNRLLQDAGDLEIPLQELAERLAPWNGQLIDFAGCIHRARLDYVARIGECIEGRLFDRENVTIRYVSTLEGKGDISNYELLLAERLKLRLQAELSSGYALVGPHRDDLEVMFDGREMRAYGSSGQQRSALIMLDLAAIEVYYKWHKEYPLFLIDDVDAELDPKRISSLLEYLEGRTQTFVTTSKKSLVEEFVSRSSVYEINDGAERSRTAETPLAFAIDSGAGLPG